MSSEQVWTSNGDDWLLNQKSMLDTTAALQTLRDIMKVKDSYARMVTVGSADVNTGEFVEFN